MLDNIRVSNNQVIVELSGKIYVSEASVLREKLLQYIVEGYSHFVIDLDGVSYIDSSGLGVLVAIQKRATQKNGTVIVRNLRGQIKELFELTRLTKVFKVE